jgi:hypothetical protein
MKDLTLTCCTYDYIGGTRFELLVEASIANEYIGHTGAVACLVTERGDQRHSAVHLDAADCIRLARHLLARAAGGAKIANKTRVDDKELRSRSGCTDAVEALIAPENSVTYLSIWLNPAQLRNLARLALKRADQIEKRAKKKSRLPGQSTSK